MNRADCSVCVMRYDISVDDKMSRFDLQTSAESHIEHTCGIVIDGLKQKDAGTWQCHIEFENEDTGKKEKEVQEYNFKVAKSPRPEPSQLCSGRDTDSGGGELLSVILSFGPEIILSEGPLSIRSGLLARPICDWNLLRSLSFDFKITKGGGRRTRTVAVISAESRKHRCCSAKKAILGVWIGK